MDPTISTTIYLRTRDGVATALPLIPTLGGIPLLSLGLAPSGPIDLGIKVYARLLGPRSNGPPRNPGSLPPLTSLELGLEGRVVAIRRVDDACTEMVIRNGGWARMQYAAVLLHAIPGVTIKASLWDSLRTPDPSKHADKDVVRAYTSCYRATRNGQAAAVTASYPPIREDPFTDGNARNNTHWAGEEELAALGLTLGGIFQSAKKGKGDESGRPRQRTTGGRAGGVAD